MYPEGYICRSLFHQPARQHTQTASCDEQSPDVAHFEHVCQAAVLDLSLVLKCCSHGRVWHTQKKTPPGALQLVPPSQRVHKPCSVTYRPIVLMCPPAPTVVMLEGFPYMSLPAESKFTWNYISHCHLQYTTITFFLFIVVSHRKVRQINFKTKSLLRNPAVAAVGSHTGSHSAQLHSYNERGESTLRSRLSQT